MTVVLHTEPVTRRVTCPTFVGREPELRRLAEAAAAAATESQIVLLSGDAGVGKTRLIEELCTRRRDAGTVTAVGGCINMGEGGGVGYAPLIEALRHLRAALSAELDALVDSSAAALRPLLAGGSEGQGLDPGAVLGHVLAFLGALGEAYPGAVVAFEDLHWADASTRDLVAFLTRTVRTPHVMLVFSDREDDLHRRHSLRPLLAELARNPVVEQMRLRPMSRSELTLLLAGVAGSVLADDLVDAVMARSEGNPFYAEELLALGRGRQLPATLRDAMLARVGHVEPRCARRSTCDVVLRASRGVARAQHHPSLAQLHGPERRVWDLNPR